LSRGERGRITCRSGFSRDQAVVRPRRFHDRG